MLLRLLTIGIGLTLVGTCYAQQESPKLLEPEEAAQTMVVPDGFSVTLFAGEPDIKQPVGFCIDDRGRLWVAEAYSYPNFSSTGRDRILIFEDTDGDGRFDKRTVFYDKLNYVTGIEVGFGGAWVMSPPNLYFIPDRDGDDIPDSEPQILLDGFGNHSNAHNLANGFSWGPDGWLYGTHGRTNWSMIGKPGTPDDQRVRFDGGVYRYHPVRHIWEPFADGTTNPWGIDFDDYGQAFTSNCVNPHLFHMIQGAHYEPWRNRESSRFAYQRIETIADHVHWYGDPRQDFSEGPPFPDARDGHAHCGIMVYLGDNWPDRYRNTVFMCNLRGRSLNNDLLRRKGSGYTASHESNLLIAKDPWFKGVTVRYGPSGAVYVIDWSDTGECHNYKNTQRQTGRIYRIAYGSDVGRISNPSQKNNGLQIHPTVDIAKLSNQELVRLQLHKNDWHVQHTRRNLQERFSAGDDMSTVGKALLDMFNSNPDVTRKLRALWALHVIGATPEAFLVEQLEHDSQYVRAWAVRLLSDLESVPRTIVDSFARMAREDDSSFVRLHIASALQQLPLEQRWGIAEALVGHAGDANDANLPLMIWYGIEPLVLADTARALELLKKTDISLLRQFIVRRVVEQDDGITSRFNQLVLSISSVDDPRFQLDALEGMQRSLRGRRGLMVPDRWPLLYEKLAKSANADVRTASLRMGVLMGDQRATKWSLKIIMDAAAAAKSRRRSLQDLVEQKNPDLPPLLHKLLEDRAVRAAALRGLATYNHPDTPRIVLGCYDSLNSADKQGAIATLTSRPAYALALLESIERGNIPRTDVSTITIRQLQNMHNTHVADKLTTLTKLWGTIRAPTKDREALKAKYRRMLSTELNSLDRANLSGGRAIFQRTCASCHTLFDEGGKIGPDLTGSDRTNLDYVLDSVLDPSAIISKDFQQTIVVTDSGRIISGLVIESNDATVTIQTPTDQIILPRDEIEEMQLTEVSMMPEDLLKELSETDVRDLIAYLASPKQVPLLENKNDDTSSQ